MTHVSALLTVIQTEFKLLIRKTTLWIYIILISIMSILVVAVESSSRSSNTVDIIVSLISNLASFQILPLTWIVIESSTKNNKTSRDWIWATPIEFPLIALAQTINLSIFLVLSSTISLLSATITAILYKSIETSDITTFFTSTFTIILAISFFELLFITSIGLLFDNKPITAIISVILIYILIVMGVILPYSTLMNPINYMLSGMRFDSVAFVGAEKPLVQSLLWLYLSVGVVLFISAILRVAWRDIRRSWHRRHTWLIYGTLLAGVTSTGSAASAYHRIVAQQIVPPPVVDQVETWQVLQAAHQGSIESGVLKIDAELTIKNISAAPLDSVVLRLNPGLELTSAQIDARPATVLPDGEAVRILQKPLSVAPYSQVVVDLSYQGVPTLLREDYSRANSRNREEPVMFARTVQSYVDATTVMLQRDGDWRAWPQTSAPYNAPSQQIELSIQGYRLALGGGEQVNDTQQPARYIWRNSVPQLLLVAGDYTRVQTEQGDVYLPQLGSRRDYERAVAVLRMRRMLADWLGDKPMAHQAVILPYTQRVASAEEFVGVPASARIGFSGVQEDTYAEPQWATGMLAVGVAQDMLQERVAWQTKPLHTEGQARSLSVVCTYDSAGKETCVREVRGERTPQAPYGRLVEPEVPSPLLFAWSVVLGRQLLRDQLGDTVLAEEQRFWSVLASHHMSRTNAAIDARLMLNKRGLLPQSLPDQAAEVQNIAAMVVQLEQVRQKQGITGLTRLLSEASRQYPPGSLPLTESSFRQLMQRL